MIRAANAAAILNYKHLRKAGWRETRKTGINNSRQAFVLSRGFAKDRFPLFCTAL